MHLSHPHSHSHTRSILASINDDSLKPKPETQTKAENLKRCSSLSSISSADTINTNTKSPDEKTRIRRCKIALSSIKSSYLKRSSVTNSTLSTLPNVKWSHITDSLLTNILTLKRAKIESATISNVVYIRRATIVSSTITDAMKIKKASIANSLVRRVALLQRSTVKNCVVNDCIIYKTDFEGMVLENGIWKGGRLVGRIDQGREVVVRALEGGEFSGLGRTGNNDDKNEKMRREGDNNDSLVKEHKGNEEEALPVYKS